MDKVHFSRCLYYPYPDKLFTFNYYYDDERDIIIPDTHHTIGTPPHNVNFRYWDISASLVLRLREKFSRLDTFELTGNASVDDAVLATLTSHFSLLSSLIISDCGAITLSGISTLPRLTSLTQLHVAGIECITDECIHSLSQTLFLQDLDISRCTNVTNASLVTLAGCRACKMLTYFRISQNPNITYRGTTQLLMYCPMHH